MRHSIGVALACLFILLTPGIAAADGFILPDRPDIPLFQSYRVDFHDVTIEVTDGVAEVRVDQAFTNLLDRPLEVSYLFPVPEGAVVDRFSLVVEGKEMPARLYDRDEARRLYEELVRQRRDPALLEYAGRGLYRTSVFPIPARDSRRVILRYHQVVEAKGDLCRLVYPLATEKYSARPIDRVTATISVSSTRPINNLYSPSHTLTILDRTDHKVVARYTGKGIVPRTDLTVYYQLASAGDFDATILAYRPNPGEDGYFLVLASPRAELPKDAVQPKTVLFVLDRSGSMAGEKLNQAKEALRTILPNLGEKDQFNLIAYNDQVETFRPAPVTAGKKEIEAALAFVDGLTALGSTDIDSALVKAVRQIPDDEGRGRYVVFLTDGQPTAGETQPDRIRASIKVANTQARARVFVFGVGNDVNTVLLDGLAQDNRGLTSYVRPGEDLEAAVAGFFRQIQHPVLTDLSLSCDGVAVSDLFPRQLPDLFHGQQLVLAGRYRGHGRATLVLAGQAGGKQRTFAYETEFPAFAGQLDRAFVARLWAARKIGYLLDQLHQLGPDGSGRKELVDEVIRLAKAFGIATEYTSFLVLEDASTSALRLQETAAAPSFGAGAVGSAKASKDLQYSGQSSSEQDWAAGRVKIVGDKTFYLREGVWVDAAYQPGAKTTKIGVYSDEYFALVGRLGAKAAYLSFAERIVLVWEGNAYQIEP